MVHVVFRHTPPSGQDVHHVAELRPDGGVVELPLLMQFLEILCPVTAGVFDGTNRRERAGRARNRTPGRR